MKQHKCCSIVLRTPAHVLSILSLLFGLPNQTFIDRIGLVHFLYLLSSSTFNFLFPFLLAHFSCNDWLYWLPGKSHIFVIQCCSEILACTFLRDLSSHNLNLELWHHQAPKFTWGLGCFDLPFRLIPDHVLNFVPGYGHCLFHDKFYCHVFPWGHSTVNKNFKISKDFLSNFIMLIILLLWLFHSENSKQ